MLTESVPGGEGLKARTRRAGKSRGWSAVEFFGQLGTRTVEADTVTAGGHDPGDREGERPFAQCDPPTPHGSLPQSKMAGGAFTAGSTLSAAAMRRRPMAMGGLEPPT